MKNKIGTKLLSALLAFVLMLLPLSGSVFTQEAQAATKTLQEVQAMFPHGKYWNHVAKKGHGYVGYHHNDGVCGDIENTVTDHPCYSHSSSYTSKPGQYTCNSYKDSQQCCGFAKKLAKLTSGKDTTQWKSTSNISTALSVMKAGDVIHYVSYNSKETNPATGHWVFITKVSSDSITVGECNYDSPNCQIHWGRKITKAHIKELKSVILYRAPSELVDRTTTHTHSFDLNGGTGTFPVVKAKFGEALVIPAAVPEKAGYTFVGWTVRRTTDDKWYSLDGKGWFSESEITSKGYTKKLYTAGSYIINSSWTTGTTGDTAYTFYAVWEPNAAPLLTVQSSTDINGDALGKFDVYINGKAVKTGVSQFTGTYPVDTAYEIKNVRGTGCYVLSSNAPALSGKLTEDTRLMLGFTEKHSYVKNTVKPTCTENGYIEYTCSQCGDTYAVTAADEWSLTKPDAPAADIETKTVYRYSTDKKTSDAASLSGYVKAGTEWQKTGEGTIDYAESFPAGFNKSSSLYTKYNVKPKTASETSAEKTTVTTTTAGYIYWHWCRNYTAGPINRSIKSNKADDFTTFHAFFSTKDVALTASANARQIDNASVCKDTYWWLNERVTIKRCVYTQYKKVNVFVKWSDWQDAKPTASGALTETSTMYRLRVSESLQATGHTWDAGKVTKAATASAEGVKTFTCTVCKETKTEAIPKTNNAFKRGDVDNDGKVSSSDARLALRGAVGFTGDQDAKNAVINFADKTSRAFLAANVDGDGKISASDARLILRATVGLEKF